MSIPQRVGLIGLGTMGALAAQSLLESKFPVCVYDTFPSAVGNVKRLGAIPADSPAGVAAESDIILMILPGPSQIESVVTGESGLLASGRRGQTIIDMSTVDPATTRKMGALAANHGIDYLDVPILGRPSAHGNWVLPAGGETGVLERCLPVLSVLGKEVIHVGPLGAGNTLKLLNAMMFSAINAMTAEMMAISKKAGLDPGVLFGTIAGSEAATVSGLFKEVGSKIVRRDFTPTFPIDLLCKDNGLAVSMARDFGAPPLLAAAIQAINELGQAQGLGSEDTSALIKVYEKLLNIEESTR